MDKYNWIEEVALLNKGTFKKYKEEWNAYLYMIDNKYYIMQCHDKEGRDIITFKLSKDRNVELRNQYPNMVVPGYYCNKSNWSSIYFDQNPNKDFLENLISESYNELLNSFSKKRQKEIEEGLL